MPAPTLTTRHAPRSLKQESDKLYRLNRIYLEEETSYKYGEAWKKITREDYAQGGGVCPYSDPAMVSDMQKMAKAQLLLSVKDDNRVDGQKAIKFAFETGGVPKPGDFLAKQPQPDPLMLATVDESKANAALSAMRAEGEKAKIEESKAKIDSERAATVKDYALAVKALADADAIRGDQTWPESPPSLVCCLTGWTSLTGWRGAPLRERPQ